MYDNPVHNILSIVVYLLLLHILLEFFEFKILYVNTIKSVK